MSNRIKRAAYRAFYKLPFATRERLRRTSLAFDAKFLAAVVALVVAVVLLIRYIR
jgi:hypothetical protein